MSGPDDADRGFLARWSQRKQQARQPEGKPDAPTAENDESPGPAALQNEDSAPELDLSTLPKLEELTASTNITAFLRKGVPEQLRNAALRKSWALDPAIRNYVSPALEYAYDWNAPGGVPGGGELGAGVDVARLVSQIMGEAAAETVNSETKCNEAPDSVEDRHIDSPESLRRTDDPTVAVEEMEAISTAVGNDGKSVPAAEFQPAAAAPQRAVRRHGTAKPIL